MQMNHFIASLFLYSSNWNIILIIIGVCSILSFAIFIERFLYLRKSEINTNQFILSIRKSIQDGNIVEGIGTCENTGGALANVVKAGLTKHDKGKEQIETSMETSGLLEIAHLEKNAKILYSFNVTRWILP